MANTCIYTTNLKNYVGIAWEGTPIFNLYSEVKNYLREKLGEEYANILAEPQISAKNLAEQGEAKWYSPVLSANAIAIGNLDPIQAQKAQNILAQKIDVIQQHIEKLLKSNIPNEKYWAERIKAAIQVPDELLHILVEGDEVVLVLWGFNYKDKPNHNATLSILLQKENKNKNNLITPHQTEDTNNQQNIYTQQSRTDKEYTDTKENIDSQENTANQENDTETKENTNTQENIDNQENKKIEIIDKNKSIHFWKRKFWRLLLLILLILLIILLLFWFFSSINGKRILPEKSGVVIPIDKDKIVKDPKGIRMIVADRLNIALVGENKDIQLFATSFKDIYPDNQYQIIYFDTLTYRIQIQIPETEREKLRKELPQKMPNFKMLIFDEKIMGTKKIPNDPGFKAGKGQTWHHEKIKTYQAWDITQGNPEIVVAVIDGGFDTKHPELKGKIYKPYNVVNRNSTLIGSSKGGDHGTHVAGIAAGIANNGQGIAGIAPNCKLMLIQVADDYGVMSSTSIIDGILYAIHNGADVVNISLGLQMPPDIRNLSDETQRAIIKNEWKQEEEFYRELFKIAYDKNITVILAGGNENLLIGLDPMQRSGYTLNVSAIDPNDKKADFSNYGEFSTLSAPGVQIFSSIPNNNYAYYNGTSMAAPIVAGAVALLKSINPTLTNKEIIDLLTNTGLPITSEKYVGNLIQLDAAMDIAKKQRNSDPKVDCPEVQSQIDSLLLMVKKLRDDCETKMNKDNMKAGYDTLKIPSKIKDNDFSFALGRWKSTTDIFNVLSGEKITIYFDFYKEGMGTITLVEPDGTKCAANLDLSLYKGIFGINQKESANCNPPPKQYNSYTFECRTDSNGNAECTAQNKVINQNRFTFKLIKIK